MNDNIKHPAHYNVGKIEVIDFIHDQQLNFNLGNAVKYICRAGRKDPDTYAEDLQKAVFYINDEMRRNTGIPPEAQQEAQDLKRRAEILERVAKEEVMCDACMYENIRSPEEPCFSCKDLSHWKLDIARLEEGYPQ